MIGSLDAILTQILFCLYHLAVGGSSHVTTATDEDQLYTRDTHQSLRDGLLQLRLIDLSATRVDILWRSSRQCYASPLVTAGFTFYLFLPATTRPRAGNVFHHPAM